MIEGILRKFGFITGEVITGLIWTPSVIRLAIIAHLGAKGKAGGLKSMPACCLIQPVAKVLCATANLTFQAIDEIV